MLGLTDGAGPGDFCFVRFRDQSTARYGRIVPFPIDGERNDPPRVVSSDVAHHQAYARPGQSARVASACRPIAHFWSKAADAARCWPLPHRGDQDDDDTKKTFLPRKRTDGGVTRFLHPSRSRQKLNR